MTTIATENNKALVGRTSIIGSLTRGSVRLAQACTLGVGGVALMMAGLGGAYLTSMTIKEFYLERHEEAVDMPEYTGYRGFPGFETGCNWVCKQSHLNFGWPSANTTFCESMASKPFSQQQGSFAAASLVSSLGLSSVCYLGSLYAFLGGLSLVGRSVDVFTSIL